MTIRLITIDDEFFKRSASGTVWGRVYFETGGQFFPDSGWTDMVVPFSSAWLEALIQIASGSTDKETVWFMDGPFRVHLTMTSSGLLEIAFVHKEAVKKSVTTTIEELLEDAVSVGKQLLTICKERGWPNSDNDVKVLMTATEQGIKTLEKVRRRRKLGDIHDK